MAISSLSAWISVCFWTTVAFLFFLFLWFFGAYLGIDPALCHTKALEFLSGYCIEQSLSIDNLFVFMMIFRHFGVPVALQQRVLLYGIGSAMIMRVLMIWAGLWLLSYFSWLLMIFGLFLIITAIKMLRSSDEAQDLSQNRLLVWLRHHLPITQNFHGSAFFVYQAGRYWATPLFLVLIWVEISDVIFALDSIPAIFSITSDPLIVITSNLLAIINLRALYGVLSDVANRFYYLKYGLAIILLFVGFKMLIEHWFRIPIVFSLFFIISVLLGSILMSRLFQKKSHA